MAGEHDKVPKGTNDMDTDTPEESTAPNRCRTHRSEPCPWWFNTATRAPAHRPGCCRLCDNNVTHIQQAQADADASHEKAREEFDRRYVEARLYRNVQQDVERVQKDTQRYRGERDEAREELHSINEELETMRRPNPGAREESETIRAQLETLRATQETQRAAPAAQEAPQPLPPLPPHTMMVPTGPRGGPMRGVRGGMRGRPAWPQTPWLTTTPYSHRAPMGVSPYDIPVPAGAPLERSESSKRGADELDKQAWPRLPLSPPRDAQGNVKKTKRSRVSGPTKKGVKRSNKKGSQSSSDSGPLPQGMRMNYNQKVEDIHTEDLNSDITDEYEELQACRGAEALIGPLGTMLNERRKAADRSGTAWVNNSRVELPEITNMAEVHLIEEYLEEVQDVAVLMTAQRLIAEAQTVKKAKRTAFQTSLINPGGWRRPQWAQVKKYNTTTGVVERVQQTGPVNDMRLITRQAAEEAGVLVNGNIPEHWGNPGAPRLTDHPAIHRASAVRLNRETPGFRDTSGLVAEVNIRGYLNIAPLLRVPEGIPEDQRIAAAAASDNLRMRVFQLLALPGNYAEQLAELGIPVAGERIWRPLLADRAPAVEPGAVVRALARAGFTTTDADEVVNYIWSWIRHRIQITQFNLDPSAIRNREAMELHLHNASMRRRNPRPERVAYTWSDSHQRWLPQFAQEPQASTAGTSAVGAGTPGTSLGEGGDHVQKPLTTSATASAPSGFNPSTNVDLPPGGGNTVVPTSTPDPSKDDEMETEDTAPGQAPDHPTA